SFSLAGPGLLTRGWRTWLPAPTRLLAAAALDEFDLVSVRVLDEGDDGTAMFHRAGFAHHPAATFANALACGSGIVHLDRHVTVPVAERVAVLVPVVGQFQYGFLVLRSVSDKSQGEAPVRVIPLTQE